MQRELYKNVSVCVPRDKDFDLEYYILESVCLCEGKQLPVFGIEVCKKTCDDDVSINETCKIEDVSVSQKQVGEIIELLSDNIVTPVALKDVVYNLICG